MCVCVWKRKRPAKIVLLFSLSFFFYSSTIPSFSSSSSFWTLQFEPSCLSALLTLQCLCFTFCLFFPSSHFKKKPVFLCCLWRDWGEGDEGMEKQRVMDTTLKVYPRRWERERERKKYNEGKWKGWKERRFIVSLISKRNLQGKRKVWKRKLNSKKRGEKGIREWSEGWYKSTRTGKKENKSNSWSDEKKRTIFTFTK